MPRNPAMMIAMWLFIVVAARGADGPAGGVGGVPGARLEALQRGVNLSHWLWLPAERDAAKRRAFISAPELRALKQAGFSCVRLPLDVNALWKPGAAGLTAAGLDECRGAIAACHAAGLVVIVDPHPIEMAWAMPDAATGRAEEYERFWTALGGALADTDPDRVILEVMNEPHGIKDRAVWPRGQEAIAAAIRRVAPDHTIIATGDDYGGVEGLLRLEPLKDANVIYSFHCYEPHIFTHQGASWGWPGWKEIRGLRYPAERANAEEVARSVTHEHGRGATLEYGRRGFDVERLREHVARAAAWSKAHGGVALWCGEFGVYAAHSPRESRLAWLRDLTSVLEDAKIGWAMWDYCGGFALAKGEAGKRELDREVVAALKKPDGGPAHGK